MGRSSLSGGEWWTGGGGVSCTPCAFIESDGRLTQSNAALARLLGYGAEDIEGRPIAELLQPDFRGRLQHVHERLLQPEHKRSGESLALYWLNRQGQVVPTRAMLELIGGKRRLIRLRLEPGAGLGKRQTDPLMASAWFQGMGEAATDVMLLVDSQGGVRFINSSGEKLFRQQRASVLGNSVEQLLSMPLRDMSMATHT
ncbi:MAG: PAS domain S-box protein, partial [Nitrosospira sp.]|nr:PAS domain S-box protein [Nitrosospira sp.]